MPRSRAIGLFLILASAAALTVSLWKMSERLSAYNASDATALYDVLQISDLDMTYEGQPVSFTIDQASDPPSITISYRGSAHTLPLSGRTNDLLPQPLRWESFFKVLRIERFTGESPDAPQGAVHIAIAHRAEPNGPVDRKAWTYTILELVPPGTAGGPVIEHTFKFGRPRAEDPDPQNPVLTDLQGDWRYAAALEVTPTLQRPKNTFAGEGITAMDWTWPAAGCSILALTIGGAIFSASFVNRERRAHAAA